MNTIAARMTAIAADLSRHEDLPYTCVLIGHRASIGVPGFRFNAIRTQSPSFTLAADRGES